MFEIASQIIICLILAALIGGIIGYLAGKSSCSKDKCNEGPEGTHELHIDQKEKATSTPSEVEVSPQEEIGEKPELLTQPKDGEKDNLQLIKGIGPVLEELLNKTGIFHFYQIANLTKEEISWLDNSMSFPGRIEREQWVEQAKVLVQKEQ